ncbi:type II toxin-antitoxin system RelE/ParE family toxin [Selenomonas sp. CM52]|uniref:type II toxin-antitoxin system RelE/ParE family toxin n=1 Tax=Selenomonas sp. CM52 TaxID=936381 RepID=UPI00027C3C76|nr:type II toxin-antitoxin system RelE/ParE family toxin [Selenomonas sp. CM52]EJU28624.1 plasmid stabilization system protein, RelE/ParE family [Selenomonas sp. CM52]
MAYRIVRTAKADEQLRDIVLYRAEVAGNAEAALEFLDRLKQKIDRLADFPESGSFPRYGALRARGYRVLIAEKHLVFYKVDKERKMVIVYAIVDGRRDYLNLI